MTQCRSGFALDFAGGRLGIPRMVGEHDVHYLRRLGTMRDRLNQIAHDDAVEPKSIGPDDQLHRAVNEVVKGLRERFVVPEARKELGRALDQANQPQTGRTPDGAHRAPNSKAFS